MALILLQICLTIFSGKAFAQESVTGFFIREQSEYSFISAGKHKTYRLKPATQEIQGQLEKLNNHDAIRGVGKFSNDHELVLESIDFVGLQRLLGSWTGSNFVFNFKTFAKVSLYSSLPGVTHGELQYAVAPAPGSQWKVFFTDSHQVSLASLNISEDHATLMFYDNQSGEPKQSLVLSKIRRK